MRDKTAPSPFESMLARLAPLLGPLGFTLTSSQHDDHAAFGSAHAIFARRGARFRLVWDGKEGALHGEWTSGDGQPWMDLEAASVAPQPFDHAIDADRLSRLEHAIQCPFAGQPTSGADQLREFGNPQAERGRRS